MELNGGDVHLEKIEDLERSSDISRRVWVANIVAQKRDKNGISGVQLPLLEEGFRKLSFLANKEGASVHCPRIGLPSSQLLKKLNI